MVLKLLLLFVSAVFCQTLFEGDRCYKNGAVGVCRNLRQCKTALDDLQNKRFPQTCSYQNNVPIVCCMEGMPTTTRPTFIQESEDDECDPQPERTPPKTGKKAYDKCIDYQQKYVYPCEAGTDLLGTVSRQDHCYHKTDQLVIRGTDAEQYEFPHMVMLGYGNLKEIKWNCGGAIISERFILTAGHCISTDRHEPVAYIVIGALRQSDVNDQSKIYKVKNIIPHPQYKSPSKYNDIALLETEQVMDLNQFTVPACLHTGDIVNDTKVVVAGWGLTHENDKQLSDILKKAVLSKFSARVCAGNYKTSHNLKRGFDDLTQSCYGDRDPPEWYLDRFESKDTCQGDSGSPIQIKDEKIYCMYTIVGVTSFGKGCGDDKPGIYTRVAQYLPWIESIVWPN